MPFFRQELAIDLGTANTVIFKDDKVVLDEPSIIAVETKTEKLVAIGHQAQLIEDHTSPRIYTVRPLMNGVIADYDAAEKMLAGGGSLLRGIAQRFTDKVSIQFRVAEDPLKAVARGTCLALKDTEHYPFLMR